MEPRKPPAARIPQATPSDRDMHVPLRPVAIIACATPASNTSSRSSTGSAPCVRPRLQLVDDPQQVGHRQQLRRGAEGMPLLEFDDQHSCKRSRLDSRERSTVPASETPPAPCPRAWLPLQKPRPSPSPRDTGLYTRKPPVDFIDRLHFLDVTVAE